MHIVRNCKVKTKMLEIHIVYMEHILFGDSTRGTSEAGLGPSCFPQSFLRCFGFGELPSWQHFTDGNRIQGTDPACLPPPQFHIHRAVSNLELTFEFRFDFKGHRLCWSSRQVIQVWRSTICYVHTFLITLRVNPN